MAKDIRIQLNQRQRLRIMQSQLRFVRLLEMNSQEVENAVQKELEENPALETVADSTETESNRLTEDGELYAESAEDLQRADYREDDIPYYRLHINNRSSDAPAIDFSPADNSESMYDILNAQLAERDIPLEVLHVAQYIVGSLDRNGYLRRTLPQIIDDIAFTTGREISENLAKAALHTVRSLDPPGVGASDLRDCLIMQLERLPHSVERNNALRILNQCYEAFTMKHIHRIVSTLHISLGEARKALDLILTLNPKPAASLGGADDAASPIIPDFIVNNEDGNLTISLANPTPALRIDESFSDAVKRMELNKNRRAQNREERKFITARYNNAKEFIDILRQRRETLFAVMTAIVELQREYFETDDETKLRGMTIKDVAERTGYDLSVISRATANKYVATAAGNFPLRHFFSAELGDEGESFTNKQVEAEIHKIIDNENPARPYSDASLRELLAKKGYDISRRTVAKYRDRLQIPVARLRKKL
ncbi:MAG: RNA polymerase factor sigma-54 [Prevotella sp.]|nr:RNA polymerase factor sigma-54 [Bacteroides sp.]MCM1366648.1 RNA polymerase factor sigma-54 [Prevotella sp.]MCM1437315.1 RNA polymerase factor sigma-54 [Prevotella sp.]